ncbi:hypothetical protein [Sphingobium yanoikuyae]|nr:hypothetical protein [Sphingobium yanoikuyae]
MAVDLLGLLVIGILTGIRGQKMDEFDALHALIFAGVWTIVAAIREDRP